MTRRLLDFYETAPWQVDALVDNLPELSGRIFCPCVGDGSLLRRLQERRPDLRFATNDINPNCAADFHLDATHALSWWGLGGDVDWVVDNPPFNVMHRIAPYAYAAALKGVVFMGRISFVEGTRERGPWLAAHPRAKQIVLERYSFTGNGKSDAATTEWLVWTKPGVVIANPGGVTAFGYKNRELQEAA